MEKAVCKVVEYLLLYLKFEGQRKTGIKSAYRTISISLKADTSDHDPGHVLCVTTISVGGDILHKDIFKDLQMDMLLLLTTFPIRIIHHRKENDCPHSLMEVTLLRLDFEVHDTKAKLRTECLEILQFLYRVSIVHPKITLHYCVRIDAAVSWKTFSHTDGIFTQNGINLLIHRVNYPRSDKSNITLNCPKLHPIAGLPYKLLIPKHLGEMCLTGELTLNLIAAVNPCLKMFPNKPSRISSIYIYLYASSLPLWLRNNKILFLTDPSRVANWEKYNLRLTLNTDQTLDGAIPDIAYDSFPISDNPQDYLKQEKQELLLYFFLEYSDTFHTELRDLPGIHQTIVREMDQILLVNQSAVRESVQSVLDRVLKDLSRALSNYRNLQVAGTVSAEAINCVISNSTNHSFREACYSNFQVSDTHSLISSMQSVFVGVGCNRVMISRVCHPGKDTERLNETAPFETGRESSLLGDSQSNDSCEDGNDPGCSSRHTKRRRNIEEVIGKDSHQVTELVMDDTDDRFTSHGCSINVWDVKNQGETKYNIENVTQGSVESEEGGNRRNYSQEDPWLKAVSNMSDWE
ncbi:type 2 DNA topoisomerase 6 subunit B-like isoform X2 [Ascaphus truei]|uniref:type 2 DNA topoisomerase 6 subunit B-like isoform X2 n=1 Tax=Ascaphus truei TaxID=8439 RepID=UPI003F5A7F54